MFKVPQTTGTPGWIVLTYENDIPVCVWITPHESRKLPCIADERICGDTFLRVEKIGENEFAVADIWMYNGNCVFACSTFEQRYNWLKTLLSTFTRCVENVTIDLIHKSDLDFNQIQIRGFECYSNDMNKSGYFVEDDGTRMMKAKKLHFPDCYEVEVGGYLRVPTLTVSHHLRSLGDSFEIRCKKVDAESWSVVI